MGRGDIDVGNTLMMLLGLLLLFILSWLLLAFLYALVTQKVMKAEKIDALSVKELRKSYAKSMIITIGMGSMIYALSTDFSIYEDNFYMTLGIILLLSFLFEVWFISTWVKDRDNKLIGYKLSLRISSKIWIGLLMILGISIGMIGDL